MLVSSGFNGDILPQRVTMDSDEGRLPKLALDLHVVHMHTHMHEHAHTCKHMYANTHHIHTHGFFKKIPFQQ